MSEFIKLILEKNKIGPIVFVTPELGKWSTVGGLGVMVDELTQVNNIIMTQGLAQLGYDVYCVSPYYHTNRKGETEYLANNKSSYLKADGVKYTKNITVTLNSYSKSECGIHVGKVNGVNLVFLHNPAAFPRPYPGINVY